MNPVPEFVPISELRIHQSKVLNKLKDGPIVLAQRSKAAAVLVDVEQWNRLLERLEDLDDSIDALRAKIELLTGADDTVAWDSVKADMDGVQA